MENLTQIEWCRKHKHTLRELYSEYTEEVNLEPTINGYLIFQDELYKNTIHSG